MKRLTGMLLIVAVLLLGPAAGAQSEPVLELESSIDGRDTDGAGNRDPIVLDPNEEILLRIDVTNPTPSAVQVDRVRMEGEAMGLTFLVYDTGVSFSVPAGATRAIEFPLDFFDLENQATGYLSTSIKLYTEDRTELASNEFVTDVRGRTISTLGLFALFALVFTAIAVAVLLWTIAKRRLSVNRAFRGLQFVLVGIGVGLCLAIGLAVLRIVAVPATASLILLLVPTVGAFALGYAMPGFLSSYADEEDLDDGEVFDLTDDADERTTVLDG